MSSPSPDVYLRPVTAAEPVPVGWKAHPAGTFAGVQLEFVYQPTRHDICRALRAVDQRLAADLVDAGYRRSAVLDGGWELWVRDRPAMLRAKLAGFRVIDGGRARGR